MKTASYVCNFMILWNDTFRQYFIVSIDINKLKVGHYTSKNEYKVFVIMTVYMCKKIIINVSLNIRANTQQLNILENVLGATLKKQKQDQK